MWRIAPFSIYLGLLTALGALANDDVEMWYVNAGAKNREWCMNEQMKNMGLTAHKHTALKALTPDCTAGGEKKGFLTDFDEQTKELRSDENTRFRIISNTCSHKQLFSKLYNSSSTADYFMVMEDDVVIDDKKFMRKIKQFIKEYQGDNAQDWQMVQIDFYGSSCKAHGVGHVGGKSVFKPRNLFKQGVGMKNALKGSLECAQYFGGQAYLVRRSQIPSIVENMESHPTVPLDWLTAQLPRGLAWKPGIAFNSRTYRTTESYNKVCNGAHFESNIAKTAGSKPVPFAKARSALRQIVQMSEHNKKAREAQKARK